MKRAGLSTSHSERLSRCAAGALWQELQDSDRAYARTGLRADAPSTARAEAGLAQGRPRAVDRVLLGARIRGPGGRDGARLAADRHRHRGARALRYARGAKRDLRRPARDESARRRVPPRLRRRRRAARSRRPQGFGRGTRLREAQAALAQGAPGGADRSRHREALGRDREGARHAGDDAPARDQAAPPVGSRWAAAVDHRRAGAGAARRKRDDTARGGRARHVRAGGSGDLRRPRAVRRRPGRCRLESFGADRRAGNGDGRRRSRRQRRGPDRDRQGRAADAAREARRERSGGEWLLGHRPECGRPRHPRSRRPPRRRKQVTYEKQVPGFRRPRRGRPEERRQDRAARSPPRRRRRPHPGQGDRDAGEETDLGPAARRRPRRPGRALSAGAQG